MSTPGFWATVRALPRSFWVANTMEIFERMAWYGFNAVAPLYITAKVAEGGLGRDARDSGLILGVVTFLLYLMPVVTGALADRYGYKRMFVIAFGVLTPSYWLLGRMTSFGGFFAVFLLVALGAAIFKPVAIGTVARCTDERTSSIGFGIFYMMVNIGGFVGPIVAGIVRSLRWEYVFVASACWIACNFFWVLLYAEPTTESRSASRRSLRRVLEDIVTVLGNGRFFLAVTVVLVLFLVAGRQWLPWSTVLLGSGLWLLVNVLYDLFVRGALRRTGGGGARNWLAQPMRAGDWRFGLYLLILSGFWALFEQMFLTMPLYIDQFVDTTRILSSFGDWCGAVGWSGAAGYFHGLVRDGYAINPEYLVNLDAGAIVLFQLFVSWFVGRFRPLPVMVGGTLLVTLGIAMTGLGGAAVGASGWIVVGSILVFSFGEMTASPKSEEYVGRIAPPERTALYMGYYFVAVALGSLFGGLLSAEFYDDFATAMHRPDVMWYALAGIGVLTAVGFLAYDRWALPRRPAPAPSA